jgi:hypothetical protein
MPSRPQPDRPYFLQTHPTGIILELLTHERASSPTTPFEFPIAGNNLSYASPAHHALPSICLNIHVVGLPKANNVTLAANITSPTGLPSLMDRGANICITNNLSSLIDAVPVTPFPLSIKIKGNALTLDNHCTMQGLLALPLTSSNYYYQQ